VDREKMCFFGGVSGGVLRRERKRIPVPDIFWPGRENILRKFSEKFFLKFPERGKNFCEIFLLPENFFEIKFSVQAR